MVQTSGITSGEHVGIHKVAGGKLLRVRLTVQDDTIAHVRFTGDFFLHPEEAIEVLEERLAGLEIDENTLLTAVRKFFDEYEFVGAEPEDIAALILAVGNQ